MEMFWRFEQLRGLKFSRPIMPVDAKSTKMRLLVGADAAESIIMIGAWGSFERSDGSWSCQHLLGRNLLADENSTIPKLELEALCGASNMKWIVKKALHDWVDSEVVFGDSRIALCWTTSENRRLGIFHRTRVLQIKRGTELNKLFHVRSDHNPCDTGTRPDQVTLDSIGPDSRWERGSHWMRDNLDKAIAQDIIKPALSLRIKPEEENDFNEGCIFEKPEVLTRGHPVHLGRISKLEERAKFTNYLLVPTKFSFPVIVRIHALVTKFVTNCSKNRRILRYLRSEENIRFAVFLVSAQELEEDPQLATAEFQHIRESRHKMSSDRRMEFGNSDTTQEYSDTIFFSIHHNDLQEAISLSDEHLSMALTYLYQKASKEVKHFNNSSILKKYTIEKNNVLLSKGRLIDGMNFIETGGLDFGDLGELGINVQVPVLDRHSPLAYSIADHVHWNMAKHKGMETCSRISLQKVHILQGPALYREIGQECIRCKMKRKKFLEVSMGPVSQHQLAIAPPMWAAQLDLFGPCYVYVPGYERETRARKALATTVHVMVFACPVTRIVNLQVIEGEDASCILEGVTRLSCEIGVPKYLMIDGDDTIKKALRELQVDIKDLEHQLHTEKGIIFDVCPVSGHNQHGQVERVIRSVQESLNDCGVDKLRLHATGLQTFLKLVENTYNNAPMGYSHGRDADNGAILKTISPNMMRVGRNNERALEGNFRLPVGGSEMVDKVDKLYQSWYKLWKDAVVPKLIRQPKWFKSDKHLQPGDLVYFQKDTSKVSSEWIMGRVDQVMRGRDGLIREATVAYRNYKENFNRLTNRAVRSLVKLFSIDEDCIQDDLAELQRRIDRMSSKDSPGDAQDQEVQEVGHVSVQEAANLPRILQVNMPAQGDEASEPELALLDQERVMELNIQRRSACCKQCCCHSHCLVNNHHTLVWKRATVFTNPFMESVVMDIEENTLECIIDEEPKIMGDSLTDLLFSVNTNF